MKIAILVSFGTWYLVVVGFGKCSGVKALQIVPYAVCGSFGVWLSHCVWKFQCMRGMAIRCSAVWESYCTGFVVCVSCLLWELWYVRIKVFGSCGM